MLSLVRSYLVMVFTLGKSCHSKIKKKSEVPCHAVVDKLLCEWSARELWDSETEFRQLARGSSCC